MQGKGYDFKSVQQFYDHTHCVIFRLPYFIIGNELSGKEVERLDLALQPVALKAVNGVLYLGNVTFLGVPKLCEFKCGKKSKPILQVQKRAAGWQLSVSGRNSKNEKHLLECLLTEQVAELQTNGKILSIQISER